MSKHILLIDDDALLVKSLAFTLTQKVIAPRRQPARRQGSPRSIKTRLISFCWTSVCLTSTA